MRQNNKQEANKEERKKRKKNKWQQAMLMAKHVNVFAKIISYNIC